MILKPVFVVICSPQPSPQLHHSRTVLPSNGEASSRHALYNRDAVDRRKGGVGGGSVDISAASNSQHRDLTADMITYRTHGIHSGDIKKLSKQTAEACTVQEVRGITMSSRQRSSDRLDQDNTNLRSDQMTLKTESCEWWVVLIKCVVLILINSRSRNNNSL